MTDTIHITRRKRKANSTPPAPPPAPKPPKKPAKPTMPPKAPNPTPTAEPTILGAPTGTIGGPLQIAFGRGAAWARVNRHDPLFLASGARHRVAPAMLKAMAVIESGGEMIWNQGGSGAYGIMQIKPDIWGDRAAALGYDLWTPGGQVDMAAAILGGDVAGVKGNTPEERFLSTYYPTAGLDVPGEDGHTPRQYLADLHELMRQIAAAAGQATPPLAPAKKVTQQDILNLISNHAPGVYISFPFRGQGNAIYSYGKGHGTRSSSEHSGIDIWMPDETPVNAIFGGEVLCVGTAGRHLWGQGCGYFTDDSGGIGKVSILTDATVDVEGERRQLATVYGHMSSSLVTVGQRIEDGQRIGRSGVGGGWPHIHLDCSVAEGSQGELNDPSIWNNPGAYHLLDPIPAIINALGGDVLPTSYAERVPMPQPQEWDSGALVTVVDPGVKLLQRARRDATEVDSPFEVGDTFEAVMLAWVPEEEAWYWITRRGTRVPVVGTETDHWPGLAA